ncbi:MAG: respiratory nitrate reductase subunit gamma [Planctomycetota bacterium]
MNTFAFIVAGVLPYVAVLVFLIGMTYRFYVWFKAPQPGKMALTPAPESTFRGVMAEALFFPSLFKGDKALWVFSWVFHVTLAFVFLGHIRVFTGLMDSVMKAVGISTGGIDTISAVFGGIFGVILLATGIPLLIRRIALKRAREVSGVPDFFALLLVIAVILTGDIIRFGPHFDLTLTRAWAKSLLTFSPTVSPHLSAVFIVHTLLAMLLIMYIPFSKILHFGGIFFTQTLVKRR